MLSENQSFHDEGVTITPYCLFLGGQVRRSKIIALVNLNMVQGDPV